MPVRTGPSTTAQAAALAQGGADAGRRGRLDALDALSAMFSERALSSQSDLEAWTRAFTRWLVDVIVLADTQALHEAGKAVRASYRAAINVADPGVRVAVSTLAEMVAAATRRAQQRELEDALEPDTWAAKMLLDIDGNPGASNTEIGARIGAADRSQISRSGRDLFGRGLAVSSRVGRTVHWTVTPRGVAAAARLRERVRSEALRAEAPSAGFADPQLQQRWYENAFARMGMVTNGGALPLLVLAPPGTDMSELMSPTQRGLASGDDAAGDPSLTTNSTFGKSESAASGASGGTRGVGGSDASGGTLGAGARGRPDGLQALLDMTALAADGPDALVVIPSSDSREDTAVNDRTDSAMGKVFIRTDRRKSSAMYEAALTMFTLLPHDSDPDSVFQSLVGALEPGTSDTNPDLTALTDARTDLTRQLAAKLRELARERER